MSKYLIAALVAALLSVAFAGLVLSGLYGWNPLGLSIVPDMTAAASVADRAAAVSAIATISAAVSTVFALIVGVIAVIAVIVAERSETKSVEQLKLDLASMVATLVSLRDRSVLYTNPSLVNIELDPFKMERESLASILSSSTGFALYVWSMDPHNKPFNDVYAGLAGLIDSTTLKLQGNFQAVANHLFTRSSSVLGDIVQLEEQHVRAMSTKLTRIGMGMRQAGEAVARDPIADLATDMLRDRVKGVPPPTSAELEELKEAAQEKIGGKASETIEHFGRAAIEGSAEERARFWELIRQLGLNTSGSSAEDPPNSNESPDPRAE